MAAREVTSLPEAASVRVPAIPVRFATWQIAPSAPSERKVVRAKLGIAALAIFVAGLVAGGYLFTKTQPRSFLSLQSCNRCLSRSDLQGLLASVLVNQAPAALEPVVVMETDMTVAIKSPRPERSIDYLVLPKKDIKNVGEFSNADRAYLIDAYAVIQRLIDRDHLVAYDVVTYGPGLQQATYLHFHLRSAT